jgi:hypothetical protein
MRFGIFILLFLGTFFNHYSQVQSQRPKTLECDLLFKKASEKYKIIFNYDTDILQNVKCINLLPESFSEFKAYVEDYAGLIFEKYNTDSWIIKKDYSHQIILFNEKYNPIKGALINGLNLRSNRYGKLFLNVDKYPRTYSISYQNKFETSFSINKDSSKTLEIYLNSNIENLPEVFITGLYTNAIYLNAQNHIKVSTKKMPLLASQTQQDAFVSLLNLPQITSPVESIAELNIKGGINDQNLVLWNGIRMFQNSHFFGLLSAYNDNLINTLTVIDNATPVQYGNALTGTVMLDFDDKFTKKNQLGGGINSLSGQVFSRLHIDENTEFSFAFQRSFTDVFNSPTFKSYTEKAFRDTDLELTENPDLPSNSIQREDIFLFKDAQFQFKKKVSKDLQINLQGIWFDNHLNYKETVDDQDTKQSNYDNENLAIGIDLRYQINDKQNFVFQSNYSQHNSEGENNTFSGNQDTRQSNQIENYFTQAYWQRDLKNRNFLLGVDLQGSILTNRFNNLITEGSLNLVQISNVYSAFGAYTYSKNRWKLYAGLKNIYYERDAEVSVEPRLSVSYKLNKNIDFILKGEQKSQNLKQIIDLDQNFLGIEKRRWVVSGDSISLPLQKTKQIEALVKWNYNQIGGYASVYARQLEGISTNDQRFQNQGQFQDLTEADSDSYGFLFHLYYKNDWLNSWISYAHVNEQIQLGNQQFDGINNLDHQITWGNNFKWRQWNFSVALQYHSGLPYTEINTNNPLLQQTEENINRINFEKPNAASLPDYFRLDSSIQYQLQTPEAGNFKFSLGLINLTNNHNILRRNFRLNRIAENRIQQTENVGLNFTINFGVLWNFNFF